MMKNNFAQLSWKETHGDFRESVKTKYENPHIKLCFGNKSGLLKIAPQKFKESNKEGIEGFNEKQYFFHLDVCRKT